MSTWLRRNRWYLIALVPLIPAALMVSLVPRWFPYQDRLPQPEAVALGETVRYSGADIQLTDLVVLEGEPLNAPAGADVVVATLSIDVIEPPEASYCNLTLLSSEHGLDRGWELAFSFDSDFEVDERFEEQCSFSEKRSYDLQVTFLVPAGQVTEPVLELSSSAASPRVLRLS